MRIASILITFTLLISCQQKPDLPAPGRIEVPCQKGGEPNLFVSRQGSIYLSWVEYLNDTTDALVFSKLENNTWIPPVEIARGSDWFVNWADFPSLVVYADDENAMAAHWLQKSAEGTYDYDIHISQSMDGGQTWNPSFLLHTDGIAAEHGFVSMLPTTNGRIFATWLDGRNTKAVEETESNDHGHDHGHGHGGGKGLERAMTLRAAYFDKSGQLYEETELDRTVCDCCQTTAVLTPSRPMVAYRNRSENEIRDIYYTRKKELGWFAPQAVHKDNWHIAGCPVNGPALASKGDIVALTWFTMATDEPAVLLSFSKNGGISFDEPIRLDDAGAEGRLDVVMPDKNRALVSWLKRTEEGGEIWVTEVFPDGKKGKEFIVSETSLSRRSGFPQMEYDGKRLIFAWTEVVDRETEETVVRSAVMEFQ